MVRDCEEKKKHLNEKCDLCGRIGHIDKHCYDNEANKEWRPRNWVAGGNRGHNNSDGNGDNTGNAAMNESKHWNDIEVILSAMEMNHGMATVTNMPIEFMK